MVIIIIIDALHIFPHIDVIYYEFRELKSSLEMSLMNKHKLRTIKNFNI